MKRTTTVIGFLFLAMVAACGSNKRDPGNGDGVDAGSNQGSDDPTPDATPCVTSVSGTVFAPNGTLPLYGVAVYMPSHDPGPMPAGPQCFKCADGLPGDPIGGVQTDTSGHFSLTNLPVGQPVPIVITTGKWRRQLTVPALAQCEQRQLTADDTSLPKSATDISTLTSSVDMPHIAVSTGSADQIECLVRKLGIADSEITVDSDAGHIHMFSDTTTDFGAGVSQFDTGFDGGKTFAASETLWGSATDPGKLANYDLVMLGCEGDQFPESKTQDSMDHMKSYADTGGRLFLTHYHNFWISGANSTNEPATNTQKVDSWKALGSFGDEFPENDPVNDTIDQIHNPKGAAFASWMLDPGVGGSTTLGSFDVFNARETALSIDNTKAERWVNLVGPTTIAPQMFQFTTPLEAKEEDRCGKVVFSDMHVSQSDEFEETYPANCGADLTLTPQEKALAFMFFDIGSCVGTIE